MILDRDLVASCYEMLLGRDLDDPAVADERGRWPADEVIASILGSLEFEAEVLGPIVRGEPFADRLYPDRLTVRHRMWIEDHLPLLASSAGAASAAPDWRTLLEVLTADPLLMSLAQRDPVRTGRAVAAASAVVDGADRHAAWRRQLTRLHARVIEDFESLGDNCEFGGLQRQVGIERLSMFRWSGVALPRLVDLLDNDLDGVADRSRVRIETRVWPNGARERMLRHDVLDTDMHMFRSPGERAPDGDDELLDGEVRRLGMLRRKFMEDVRAGRRIFLYRSERRVERSAMLRLHHALQRHGANRLLVVHPAGDGLPAGSVRSFAPDIVEAALDVFALGVERYSELWPIVLRRARALLPPRVRHREAAA